MPVPRGTLSRGQRPWRDWMLNSARHACSQLKRVGSSCTGRKDTESQQPCLGKNAVQRLPVALTEVKQGEEMGSFDMVKVDMPIPSPVSGVIEEINEELGSNLLVTGERSLW